MRYLILALILLCSSCTSVKIFPTYEQYHKSNDRPHQENPNLNLPNPHKK